MAFSSLGAKSNERIATGDPVSVTLTGGLAVGDVLVVVTATDDSNRTLNGVTDSQGNTWTVYPNPRNNGSCAIAYTRVSSALNSGQTVSLDWSSSTDTMAMLWGFRGLTVPNVGQGADDYTASATYAQSVTASDEGVMIVVFGFGFDYSFGGVTISGWSKIAEIDDNPDQSMQAYYKQVSAGSNTCSKTIGTSVGHVSAGVVLPYAVAAESRQSVVVVM